jgi:hypothetical protein
MRTSSRNSRGLGLVAAVALLLGSVAHAADPPHSFVVTVYSNAQGGNALLSGDYATASKQLRSTSLYALESADSNNRCVALMLTKQLDAARTACDAVVRSAESERSTLPSYYGYAAQGEHNDYVVIALSNRAVLHWLAADSEAAAEDLHKAERLSPNNPLIARNRAALEYSHTTVAQIALAPVSR